MKKVLSFILAFMIIISVVPLVFAAEVVAAGKCGENAAYTLDSKGLLTISGTGSVASEYVIDWEEEWYLSYFRNLSVKKAVVKEGITEIDTCAFYNCKELETIELPESVIFVGEKAFDSTAWYKAQPDGAVYLDDILYSIKGTAKITDLTVKDGTRVIAGKAFRNAAGIEALTIPDSVIGISANTLQATKWYRNLPAGPVYAGRVLYAIKGNCADEIFKVADGTVTIGEELFYKENCGDNSKLKTVILPDSIKNIGSMAFVGCTNLESVNIPDGIENIFYGAFLQCKKLTEANIPDTTGFIGDYAFSGCETLKDINIPKGMDYIPGNAFSGCTGLTSVEIPENITSINDEAFRKCSGLTSVNIPDTVKNIGRFAFAGCNSLTSVKIPDKLESLGQGTFNSCKKLSSVNIPSGITELPQDIFSECSSLKNIDIPSNIKTIGFSAFSDSGLTKITIPETVSVINGFAFSGCKKLTSIALPSAIKTIKENTFSGCSGLTEITLPEGITKISTDAFRSCKGLTSIKLPSGLKTISDCAFEECSALTAIDIPDSVTSIGEYAFSYCTALASVRLPAGLTSIKRGTFRKCTSLQTIKIPSKVTTIGESAFEESGLTTIKIPASVTTIKTGAFRNCKKVTSINIGSRLKKIEFDGLIGYPKLTSIVVSKSNKYFDSRNNCNALIESSTDKLVLGCNATVVPDGVKTIGINAFYLAGSLTSITLPYSVTKVETFAFNGCNKLKKFTVINPSCNINNEISLSYSATVYGIKGSTAEQYAKTHYNSWEGVKFVALTVPKAPAVTVSNVVSTGKIKLTWSKVSGAEKYEIYRSTSKNGTYTKISTTTGTSFTNSSVTVGKTYYYKVKAVSSKGVKSNYSSAKSLTCRLARPAVTITLSSSKPKLTWKKVTGATKYYVYRASSKTGTYKKIATVTGTSFRNSSAVKGKGYYYKVRAFCEKPNTASEYSAVKYIRSK